MLGISPWDLEREMRRSGSGRASVFESARPMDPPCAPNCTVIGWVMDTSFREIALRVRDMRGNAFIDTVTTNCFSIQPTQDMSESHSLERAFGRAKR